MITQIVITSHNRRFCFVNEIPLTFMQLSEDSIHKINGISKHLLDMTTTGIQSGHTFNDEGQEVSIKVRPYDLQRVANFIGTYGIYLYCNFSANPELYGKDFDQTFERMKKAILEGSCNKDSESFKQTCKALKINHTYKAIEAYLKGE